MNTFLAIWSLVIAGVLVWCYREERAVQNEEVYCPNEALAYFTQWQLKADSDLTWCRDGYAFETHCQLVNRDLFMEGIRIECEREHWTAFHQHRLERSLNSTSKT